MDTHVDREESRSGDEQASLLEEQAVRCEVEMLEQVCTTLSQLNDEMAEDMAVAFARLEAGMYGYCVECHREIPVTYLDAEPFAIRCPACELAEADQTYLPAISPFS